MQLLRGALQLITHDKLSVFLFHKVPRTVDPLAPNDLDANGFANFLDFVGGVFRVLPLREAVERLVKGTLPSRSAAITFDDGYPDWRYGVVPMLEEKSLPATFFITTGQILGRPMWHERLANVVRSLSGRQLDTAAVRLPPIQVGTRDEKVVALETLEFHFKYLPPAIREVFLNRLENLVGATAFDVPRMSIDDLRDISDRGFEIGAHTVNHPILGLCDTDSARDEIGQAKEVLESIIKAPVAGFAYPNGRPGTDFSQSHIQMVRAAGYRYAVTTQWGVARRASSPYQIPRFTPWGPTRRQMSLQLLRNLYAKPESLRETA